MTTAYAPGAQIDHYEIVRQLGHGGMSRVYRAQDILNGQTVVLKFPSEDLIGNIGVFERYKREGEIGNRINHPNIQHMLNIDEKRSGDYLVMEYIEGRSLRAVLDEQDGKLLPISQVLNIVLQLCDALTYCHEHGVFHRDIKPENIMVQNDGTVKIIDFGIALLEGARRVTWRGLTGTVGTPDYMAPEQLKGERGTARTDVYAVGILLYEMLCGRTPFDGENVFAVMNQHITQDPPSILDYRPDLSPELATVVMKAIRRDPEKRFTSMRDFWEALRHWQDVKPVAYHPEKPGMSTTRRQILWSLLIIAIILVIIVAIGIGAQYMHHLAH